jgi:hypothetical protein
MPGFVAGIHDKFSWMTRSSPVMTKGNAAQMLVGYGP